MTEARKDRRAPASIKVKYKSANMLEFVELVGGDVSRGGIFVKTKKPLEPGALLKFEFQLQGGEPMIYGVGRVAWRRTEEGSRANLPAGMGIKFIKLNGLSRSVIDRIEARHGPGSRFDQTDGAEIASSISSAPPSGMSQAPADFVPSLAPSATLITPLRPEAARDAAEADAVAATRTLSGTPLSGSGRPQRSSPPLREARTSGPKSGGALPATFRPPPPAAVGSIPPPHAAPSSHPPGAASARPSSSGAFGAPASNAAAVSGGGSSSGSLSSPPRGVLGSGAPSRRPVAPRSAARDASEFLASAFSVGGAGREVRSEAHAQVERARHDPRSVDLANELFGDLNAPGAKPDAALDADPMLNELSAKAPANSPPPAAAPSLRPSLADRLSGAGAPDSAASSRSRTSPKPAANDHLSLKLGTPNVTTDRPSGMSGRALWIAVIACVGIGIGAAAFYLQRAADHDVAPQGPPPTAAASASPQPSVAPPQPPDAPKPAEAAVSVELAVSSEPAGADVSVDGAPAGATPVTLKLREGKTVQISVHKAGFATKNESVSAAANMPARSLTLEALPFELVVTEPVGATVKVLDKSVEAPSPIHLGVKVPDELTVSVEKAGFQRATRKLTRADFVEQASAMRAELSMPLQPTAAAARAAKAPPAKAAAAKAAPVAVAPDMQAPPEPETAAPAAEAKHEEKAAAPAEAPSAPAPTPAPEAQAKPEPAPAPVAPAKPPPSDIPTDL